jgi:hypothetical protein
VIPRVSSSAASPFLSFVPLQYVWLLAPSAVSAAAQFYPLSLSVSEYLPPAQNLPHEVGLTTVLLQQQHVNFPP